MAPASISNGVIAAVAVLAALALAVFGGSFLQFRHVQRIRAAKAGRDASQRSLTVLEFARHALEINRSGTPEPLFDESAQERPAQRALSPTLSAQRSAALSVRLG
jgi:hypothetical protein